MVSASPAGRIPANPKTSACHTPPRVARCSPPEVVSREVVEVDAGREIAAAPTASSSRPARANSAAWIAGDSELPWAVRGS